MRRHRGPRFGPTVAFVMANCHAAGAAEAWRSLRSLQCCWRGWGRRWWRALTRPPEPPCLRRSSGLSRVPLDSREAHRMGAAGRARLRKAAMRGSGGDRRARDRKGLEPRDELCGADLERQVDAHLERPSPDGDFVARRMDPGSTNRTAGPQRSSRAAPRHSAPCPPPPRAMPGLLSSTAERRR